MTQPLLGLAVTLTLLAGCAATPPPPPLAAATPSPPPALTVDALLRGGGPDAARHRNDAQRSFPATNTATHDVGPHETAKFFFQSLVDATRTGLPPGHVFEADSELRNDRLLRNVCTIHFDDRSGADSAPRSGDFPRIVTLTYSESRLTHRASIDITRRDRLTGPPHRSRIVFAERPGFTDADAAQYYGFPTIPKTLYGYGLPCLPSLGPPVGDDGGGGGEM